MVCGTIMFFSQEGRIANVWCPQADTPLVSLLEDDFSDQWSRFKVGVVVDVEYDTDGQTVSRVEICEPE